MGAVFEGVGVSLGSLIGGMLYESYKGPLTFRLFGIGALVLCLLHAGVQYLLRETGNNTKSGGGDIENKNQVIILEDKII